MMRKMKLALNRKSCTTHFAFDRQQRVRFEVRVLRVKSQSLRKGNEFKNRMPRCQSAITLCSDPDNKKQGSKDNGLDLPACGQIGVDLYKYMKIDI